MRTKITLVLVTLIIAACATSPTGRRQLMLVSEQQAISASKEAYLAQLSELNSQGKISKDSRMISRVDEITGRLITQAIKMRPDTRNWEWSVEVIDDPETVNAWCMAGGRMAIYSGLISKVDPTDDELAQVMGHEISHALANHTAERMSVAMASNLGMIAAGAAAGDSQLALGAAAVAAQFAVQLPNSRASETEADRIGIELAAKAGYDPAAAATLWKKMGAVGGSRPPAFMSTHPSPQQRSQKLAELAAQMRPYYLAAGSPPVYRIARTRLDALSQSGSGSRNAAQ